MDFGHDLCKDVKLKTYIVFFIMPLDERLRIPHATVFYEEQLSKSRDMKGRFYDLPVNIKFKSLANIWVLAQSGQFARRIALDFRGSKETEVRSCYAPNGLAEAIRCGKFVVQESHVPLSWKLIEVEELDTNEYRD